MDFLIFGILSLLVFGGFMIVVLRLRRQTQTDKQVVSPLTLFTAGAFFASVLMFVPVSYHWDGWKDTHIYLRPVLMAITNAVRVFLAGVEFDIVEDAVPAAPAWLKVSFCLYAAFLYALTPILTFSNVLSMFRNMTGEMKLRLCRNRPIYILSELNAPSVALADSLVNGPTDGRNRPLIVFCDVFAQNEEENYELLQQAKRLNAICLKKDAAHLALAKKGKPVDIFLIGENEAENTDQAITLTATWKDSRRNVSLYVFSSDPATDHILDTLDIGSRLMHPQVGEVLKKHLTQGLVEQKWQTATYEMGGGFSLRRIDPVDILVQDVLTRNNYEDYIKIQEAAQQTKTISITILGMGHHGTHFLKTALWFYQRYGIRLEFNVFDMGGKNGDPQKRLAQQCPEFVSVNPCAQPGDSSYDIRFFTGIDCFSADFNALVLNQERTRFEKTNLVFVALGDDDRNIRAAMVVQTLFAQLQVIAADTKLPFIYSVVYDDDKAANLNLHPESEKASKEVSPFQHIRFVGARLDRYSREVLMRINDDEKTAFSFHLDWLKKENQLHAAYRIAESKQPHPQLEIYTAFKNELDQERQERGYQQYWGDTSFFLDMEKGLLNVDEVMRTASNYMRYSYYRQSSLAKAIHKKALSHISHLLPVCGNGPLCNCQICQHNRITEHMRWNAYMRSLGYRYNFKNGKRNALAKLHPDICPWQELSCQERYKD